MIVMDDYDLLRQIGAELRIRKGTKEDKPHWYARIIYSSIGRMALASLFDQLDNDADVISKAHFTQRVKELLDAYHTIFPALNHSIFQDDTFLSSTIYDQYESTGYLYHEPYRICAAVKTTASLNGVRFIRNSNCGISCCMSGLGLYDLKLEEENRNSIGEMFQLDEIKLSDVLPMLLKSVDWRRFDVQDSVEYLQVNPSFRFGYWKSKPDTETELSLMRYGIGEKQYALYRSQDGTVQISTLPKWQYEGGQHFLIANAILSEHHILPDIKYFHDGNIVTVVLGYLLPAAEQQLFMLYSWPHDMNCEKETLPYLMKRDMSKEIFQAIRMTYEKLGLHFTEVGHA